MRGGACLVALAMLVSGCAGFGGMDEPTGSGGPPGIPAARILPDTLTLTPGERVAAEPTRATFRWAATVPGGVFAAPQFGAIAGDDTPAVATLALPADVELRVSAALSWEGDGDLDLFVDEGDVTKCSDDAQRAAGAAKACSAWSPAGAARGWTVEVWPVHAPMETPFVVEVVVESLPALPTYAFERGPASSVAVPDPATPGASTATLAEYDFGATVVEDTVTGRTYPARVVGVVHFPTAGDGPFPLVVLLHGQHDWCDGGLSALPVSHCRAPGPAGQAIASHRGYDDVAAHLAGHGYVVASIDANDVNALNQGAGLPPGDVGMDARAKLVLATLDGFEAVHGAGGAPQNPALDALRGKLDLDRIGLMGHSRGAEGVTRAPSYAGEVGHWSADAMRAVYALAGTTRPQLAGMVVPPMPSHVAYAAVSPYCDGDVWSLGSTDFFDVFGAEPARGPLVNLLFMGSNHNDYNTMWTDDDADFWGADPACGGRGFSAEGGALRLAPEDVRRHQLVYLSAFVRAFVGDETALRPLFTGEAAPPASACPRGLEACPGLVHVSWAPPAADALSIEDAAAEDALARNDLGGATSVDGLAVAWCDPRGAPESDPCAWPRSVGNAPRLRLAYETVGSWRTEGAMDLTSFDALALRIGVDFDDGLFRDGVAPRVALVLEDASGARGRADLDAHAAALFPPPGAEARRVTLNQVRVPLDAFAGVDLAGVRAVELRIEAGGPGAVHVAQLQAIRLA